MIYSNTETNFRRLLNKTEEIAEKQDPTSWRFEKVLKFFQCIKSINITKLKENFL